MCFTGAHAQKIYSVNSSYQADVKVFMVDHEYQADLIVYKTDKDYRAKKNENKGIWFFTTKEYQADKKVFFVEHEYQADLKVYFTDKEYRAGWKKTKIYAILAVVTSIIACSIDFDKYGTVTIGLWLAAATPLWILVWIIPNLIWFKSSTFRSFDFDQCLSKNAVDWNPKFKDEKK